MGSIIQISVDTRGAVEKLSAARGAVRASESVNRVAAEAAGKLVRGWFLSRNTRSQRSNYWSQAAEATFQESDATSARLVIRHPGVRWHRYGGTIRAKPGKSMSIPLRDAVKGVWPSEKWPDRKDAFVWRRRGKAFLAAREGNALRIFYLLVKSVTKAADPSVLPSDAAIAAAASEAIRQLLRRALAGRPRS